MDNEVILTRLEQVLPGWYELHKRCLPWREDRDPYHIWVSEIMLQQTRVEAVKGYYSRFLAAFPTVNALAEADDDLLHKLWEGLGYYSRVRNLKKAAQILVNNYGGIFPREYDLIIKLPGIGSYTAGAICSIAFDQPTPAVDGNVLRLFSRLTDDDTPVDLPEFKKMVSEKLQEVYPARAGEFTQALMELGATLCGPNRDPECDACPCKDFCKGNQNKTAAKLPVRLPKKEKRTEEKTVFILSCGGRLALRKRPKTGLLASMWEFPNVPGHHTVAQALEWVEKQGIKPKDILRQVEKKHIFTHIIWDMRGVYVEAQEESDQFCWLSENEIRATAALPTAFRIFLEDR